MSEKSNPTEVDTSPQIEIKPPVSAKEMVGVSEDIKRVFSDEPDFQRSFERRKTQAKAVLEGWMHGEISLDQATDIIAAQDSELEMALETDQLMDIPNRPALERIMMEQISAARRDGKSISIAFVDLDKFGEINKQYENAAGDATLQAVGAFLKSELRRPTDKVGRKGGEELIVVLPDTDEVGAVHVLEGMKQRMPETVAAIIKETSDYEFNRPITMSAGIITSTIDSADPRDPETIMYDLMKIADSRMRLAKNNGRNRVVDSVKEKEILEGKHG